MITKRIAWAVVAVTVSATALAGCSSPAVSNDSASALQALVQEVGTTAATGDASAALLRLDAVQAKLGEYAESGDITADRATEIQLRIDRVRSDLQALVPTPVAPVETPAPVVEQPVAPVAPVDTGDDDADDDADDGGNGDKGKGNGNGNGDGNGNGNGNGKGKND